MGIEKRWKLCFNSQKGTGRDSRNKGLKYGLTAYDAAYLELAKRKNLSLATFDKELIDAAHREGVVLPHRS